MSPRSRVRVAAIDAYGDVLNQYSRHQPITGPEPDAPWAVYLAGPDHRFRLLAFDLDAKTPAAAAAAARDADAIAGLLTDAGIAHVVCQSGPSGGRHVWAGLAEPVDADTVATVARLARHLCPTLDIAPLTNPTTGCVRPPGAPHRAGGHSTVLRGDIAALTTPTTTATQVRTLAETLARLVDADEPTAPIDPRRPLPVDEHGRIYLPGTRRELTSSTAAALEEDAASGDASAVLWRILIGAAAARWRHADIAALVDTAPGLEHVRSERRRGPRRARGRTEAAAVLRRQWDKAVRYIATTDRQIGDDPTFDRRADAITHHVRTLQARADAAAGRWTRGSGPTDRRILDVLCTLALHAISASVEADTRRIALQAGIGRETARTGLLRLAADGWIAQTHPGEGPNGAHWSIDPDRVIPSTPPTGRSQADPRPAGAGAAERTTLLTTLTSKTRAAAHDLFTPGPGLGHHAGNIYALTSTTPTSTTDLAHRAGIPAEDLEPVLHRLHRHGVLLERAGIWRQPVRDGRRSAAQRLGVDGRLQTRTARYAVEREMWAWWRAEDAWMRSPRRTAASRRPSRGQLSLMPEAGTNAYGPHPRRPDGRLDWAAARHQIEAERGGVAHRAWPLPTQPPAADATETMLVQLLGAVRIA